MRLGHEGLQLTQGFTNQLDSVGGEHQWRVRAPRRKGPKRTHRALERFRVQVSECDLRRRIVLPSEGTWLEAVTERFLVELQHMPTSQFGERPKRYLSEKASSES